MRIKGHLSRKQQSLIFIGGVAKIGAMFDDSSIILEGAQSKCSVMFDDFAERIIVLCMCMHACFYNTYVCMQGGPHPNPINS